MATTASVLYDEMSSSVATEPEGLTAKLEEIATKLLKSAGATGVAIACRQSNFGALICMASAGKPVPPIGAYVHPSFGIAGRCLRECRPQKSYDTHIDPRVDQIVCRRLGIRSVAAVPLLFRAQCIGLIEAFSNQPGHFDPQRMEMIEDSAASALLLLRGEGDTSIPIEVQSPNSQNPQYPASEDRERQSSAA